MANLYRVNYVSKSGETTKCVSVSATTEANAAAAAKAADPGHVQHITTTVVQQNIIAGS